ncbi:MAG: peptidoglycan editing factor PgeF [Nevskiaceae bacterium]
MTTRGTDLAAVPAAREARWLRQVHGAAVARLAAAPQAVEPQADASVANAPGVVCAIKSADCLPVLFCDEQGTAVGAAHAGWRGLSAGVLEATVAAMPVKPAALLAWMGAAIGPASFEVGAEVREAFVAGDTGAAACFTPRPAAGKYLADLYGLARRRLAAAGVQRVYGGGLDTLRDAARFYSYRRDGRTGRMVSLVWLEGSALR